MSEVTPEELYRDHRENVFLPQVIAWAEAEFTHWLDANSGDVDSRRADEKAGDVAAAAWKKFHIVDEDEQEAVLSRLYLIAGREIPESTERNEDMKNDAQMLVNRLLDGQGQPVEVEYRTTSIDSMPHVIWMIRAIAPGQTNYLATGTGHNQQDAERQVAEQARLLGVTVARVTKGPNSPAQNGS